MRLLVRTPNWLGDIVMALPAIQAIRDHFTNATMTLAAPDGLTSICAALPGVDDVLPLPRGSTWRTWRAQRDAISAGDYHLAILLTNSWGSAWVTRQAGVPERWGYRTDLRGPLLTRSVERPRPDHEGLVRPRRLRARAQTLARPNVRHRVHAVMTTPHHSHYYLALTEALGMAPITSFSPIPVSPDALARARQMLVDRGAGAAPTPLRQTALPPHRAENARGGPRLPPHRAENARWGPRLPPHRAENARWGPRLGAPGGPFVGIAPGAAYGHAKRWPFEYVADVMIRLGARGVVPVLLGAPGDRGAARAIESALALRGAARERETVGNGERQELHWINLVGETDLPTLMGVLASCMAVLSNDSGAMHLASAVGRPVVALFGPTNEEATSPLGPHSIVTTHAWCRPCMLRECPIDHRCMRGIRPETVFDRVMTWVDREERL